MSSLLKKSCRNEWISLSGMNGLASGMNGLASGMNGLALGMNGLASLYFP